MRYKHKLKTNAEVITEEEVWVLEGDSKYSMSMTERDSVKISSWTPVEARQFPPQGSTIARGGQGGGRGGGRLRAVAYRDVKQPGRVGCGPPQGRGHYPGRGYHQQLGYYHRSCPSPPPCTRSASPRVCPQVPPRGPWCYHGSQVVMCILGVIIGCRWYHGSPVISWVVGGIMGRRWYHGLQVIICFLGIIIGHK